MENEIVCLDTSILIEYYRKIDKKKTVFFNLTQANKLFSVSVITEYEIMVGSNNVQNPYWHLFFDKLTLLPFTRNATLVAINIYKQLKKKNQLIEIPDILIAATAISKGLKLVTLNKKHFTRIEGLELIDSV